MESWEQGDDFPTYGQLEKLAYQIYRRPLAIFFFPDPPDEADPRTEFRLLPAVEIESLDPDTLLAARYALSMQESLRELTHGRNPCEQPIFKTTDARRFEDLPSLCERVRTDLGVTLADQMSWTSLRDAFKSWRDAFESRGVFVFKRSFADKGISGFCLTDDEFPVIFVNNSTSDSRQIFTLFHELAHLLFSASGVTKFDLSYLDELNAEAG